jgi:glycosyltransferase involved in cell wall biosynthesis
MSGSADTEKRIPCLSIVLPCYNEAANLPLLLARFRDCLHERNDIEVMLVDNGSTDASAEVLAAALAESEFNRFARFVRVPVNRGYGFGIMAGVRAATGEVIAWTHADLQTDPQDVLDGYASFSRLPDPRQSILKGRRRDRPALDAFFTLGMSVVASLALGQRLFDVNAQPKMFHRSFLDRMTRPPDDFSLDLYVLYVARREGLAIVEYPVSFGRRLHGVAKGGGTLRGKWKLICRTWAYLWKLRAREARQGD